MVNVYEIRPGSYATVAEAKEGGSESDVTKEYVDAGLATKQDQLTAGANITIVENVISATGELASTEWGEIGGSMSNQTDLTNALDAKASASDVAGLSTRVGDAETAIAGLDASKMDKVTLATVATTGDYDDLSNKPTIPDVSGLASVTYVDSEIDGVEAQIPDVSGLATKTEVTTGLAGKQDMLVSGTNIKTINSTSVLGSGDIAIAGVPDTTGATAGDVLTFDGTNIGWDDIDDKANMVKNAGAPTIATVGAVGDFYYDTTNSKLYQCTAVTGDGGDPEVFTYTWTEVGGGSAPSNMVTTDTEQVITGMKTLRYYPSPSLFPNNDISLKCSLKGETYSSLTRGLFELQMYTTSSSLFYGGRLYIAGRYSDDTSQTDLPAGVFCNIPSFSNNDTVLEGIYHQTGYVNPSQIRNHVVINNWTYHKFFRNQATITGDGTTTTFTVTHSLEKMPGIVQVTDSNGVVIKDSEITITKTTSNVSVTFTTAPAADATYTVAMLY